MILSVYEVLVWMTSYLLHILQWWARGGLSDSPGIKLKKQRGGTTMIPHSSTRIHQNSGIFDSYSPLKQNQETCIDPTKYSHRESMWSWLPWWHSAAWNSFACKWMFMGQGTGTGWKYSQKFDSLFKLLSSYMLFLFTTSVKVSLDLANQP